MLLDKAILYMPLFTSPIKIVVWAVFVLSGIALLLLYVLPGQSRSQRPPHPPPGADETFELTGIVKQFESNRTGDIDKLLISNSDSNYTIAFPPHLARQIMNKAPKGTTVEVMVVNGRPGPENASRLRLIEITIGSSKIIPENIPPPPPSAGKPVILSGTVQQLLTNEQEEVSGFMLDSFWVVIPPHFSRSVSPLLQQGSLVQVQGYERNPSSGFINMNGTHLLKPYRITIDSTDYLL